jgi:error-prone DNA polymerase
MGFYTPATLVEDAKRRNVDVLPIDVQKSEWDCTLEREKDELEEPRFAVRMGLRYVKGIGEREQRAFSWAPPPYRSLEDLIARTKLARSAYQKLAEAGALDALVPGRRDAIWAVREVFTRIDDRLALGTVENEPAALPVLHATEEVLWDYRRSDHSTRGHPVGGLREQLKRRGLPTARELNKLPDGTRASYVGMTICRQRPGTATGVTFYTLEDETGFVNLVVWRPVFEEHAVIARTALLLGVSGKIQSEGGVIHLIADTLWEPQLGFAAETTPRNFH